MCHKRGGRDNTTLGCASSAFDGEDFLATLRPLLLGGSSSAVTAPLVFPSSLGEGAEVDFAFVSGAAA